VALLQEPRWTVITPDLLEGKLTSHLESADALIVRSAVQVNAALLAHAHKLEWWAAPAWVWTTSIWTPPPAKASRS